MCGDVYYWLGPIGFVASALLFAWSLITGRLGPSLATFFFVLVMTITRDVLRINCGL